MNAAEYDYTPPQVPAATVLPEGVLDFLDGNRLLAKTQALRLATVDANGWPHAALLSAGEALALPPKHIRFVVFPRSATADNLRRDGRLVLTLSLDGGIHELRMRARPLDAAPQDLALAFFEAELEGVRIHKAPYATVTTGVTFALHAPDAVLPRWQRQIAVLRTT